MASGARPALWPPWQKDFFFRDKHGFQGGACGERLGKEPSVGPGAEEGDEIEDLVERERVEEPLRHR